VTSLKVYLQMNCCFDLQDDRDMQVIDCLRGAPEARQHLLERLRHLWNFN
jgi:hypothetical protein